MVDGKKISCPLSRHGADSKSTFHPNQEPKYTAYLTKKLASMEHLQGSEVNNGA